MGLLDQVLGGLGGGLGRSPIGRSGVGGGMGGVLMSLLPVVLGMLANRSAGGPAQSGVGLPGGGGGLGGLLEQFTQRGYGKQAQSWISTGQNEPLDPGAVSDVLGSERIGQIAAQAGVSEEEARRGLAQLLPDAVDHFTPHGKLPDQEQLLGKIDDYQQRLGT